MSKLRIKVSQFVYGDLARPDSWFAKYVEPINRMYSESHGYEYIVERLDTVRQDRHGNWEKVNHIKRNLTDCDYLFFIDADACFYCHQIAIHEDIVDILLLDTLFLLPVSAVSEKHRWLSSEPSCNAGVILVKNTELSHSILSEWDHITDMQGLEHLRWEWPLEEKAFNSHIIPKYEQLIQPHPDYYMLHSTFGYFVRHIWGGCGFDRKATFRQIYHSSLMERNRKLWAQLYERDDYSIARDPAE